MSDLLIVFQSLPHFAFSFIGSETSLWPNQRLPEAKCSLKNGLDDLEASDLKNVPLWFLNKKKPSNCGLLTKE